MLVVPIDLSDKRDAGQGVTTNRLCLGVGYSLTFCRYTHHQQFMKHTNQKLMTRRNFARTTALTSIGVMAAGNILGEEADKKGVGPVLGHIDENRIFTFVRAPREGGIELIVTSGDSQEAARLHGVAETENDLCVQFEVSGLMPDTAYTGKFLDSKGKLLFEGAVFSSRTPPKTKDIERVVLG
ncbi:hypothetical protein OAF33_02280, partial [bacterium]|nr:hypothetical protein [bacterium]